MDHTAAATTTPPPPAKHQRKPALPALTGIRAFLALNIVFFHFSNPKDFSFLAPMVDNAFVFVACFFLISGFILSYNYADRGKAISKRDFWVARFSRLYPIYLLALAISYQMLELEWHYQTRQHFAEGLILTPLLLQGFSPLLATFWNTVAWTLSSEVILYIGFPYLVMMPWPRSAKRLGWMFMGFWALGLVLPGLYLWLHPDGILHTNRYSPGMWLRTLKFTPIGYIPTFLAGFVLGKIQNVAQIADRARLWMAVSALIVLALIFHWWIYDLPYPMLHVGLLSPLFALLILGLAGEHIIAKFFALRPLVVFGEATYCLYLLHFNAINLMNKYHVAQRLHVMPIEPWFSYTVAVLLALAAYYLVENPGRRWILDRWGHRK